MSWPAGQGFAFSGQIQTAPPLDDPDTSMLSAQIQHKNALQKHVAVNLIKRHFFLGQTSVSGMWEQADLGETVGPTC